MRVRIGLSALVGLPAAAVLVGAAPMIAGPTPGSVTKATETTAVLADALVAAVVSLSDAAPPDAPPEQIEAASDAVSLLLAECQDRFRLIDASGDPLDPANLPQGSFEIDALADVVNGAGVVQRIVAGELRTVIGLTNDMHPNCASCHANYSEMKPGTVVGAASFRVETR